MALHCTGISIMTMNQYRGIPFSNPKGSNLCYRSGFLKKWKRSFSKTNKWHVQNVLFLKAILILKRHDVQFLTRKFLIYYRIWRLNYLDAQMQLELGLYSFLKTEGVMQKLNGRALEMTKVLTILELSFRKIVKILKNLGGGV